MGSLDDSLAIAAPATADCAAQSLRFAGRGTRLKSHETHLLVRCQEQIKPLGGRDRKQAAVAEGAPAALGGMGDVVALDEALHADMDTVVEEYPQSSSSP